MTEHFKITCKDCGGGWILSEVGSEDTPDALVLFPRMLCLGCGASEDMRGISQTAPNLVALASSPDQPQGTACGGK